MGESDTFYDNDLMPVSYIWGIDVHLNSQEGEKCGKLKLNVLSAEQMHSSIIRYLCIIPVNMAALTAAILTCNVELLVRPPDSY